jgi:enoyl-CoA hydratase
MLCRLADAWQDVSDDPDVRVAILTGAGDDAFCAGADLDALVRMMQGLRPPETDYDRRIVADYTLIYKGLLRNFDVVKPIIAAGEGLLRRGRHRDPADDRHPGSPRTTRASPSPR